MSKKIFAVCGGKNSGKTTFIENLIKYFNSKGFSCAAIKHDGHTFEPDTPGSDSYKFFKSGANATAVFDGEKFSIVKRQKINICEIIKFFDNEDIIIIEGMKFTDFEKIWILSDEDKNFQMDKIKNIKAFLHKDKNKVINKNDFYINDVEKIADYILKEV